ncbi:bifunctional [glutamine synthetase] adenylyltransferase/[glutamine synthetase]-adenylyl-L-tyrosine phosphorylase [Agromyces aerolatus]|uniref:bifunctional [glutamine synthetase] adenylyltransferase/[glutamine synthetase]-adenylyl-L-tyrosine phosphorylase n=1 Tax=Agromyces sp. LY-1074 TaxID=3074080 RepID=UPI002862DADA|nr:MULTISPECIES: bifunctional [glutamine synthetase] adenylyltransferase/[glutamine synthetase]-adenylyl-L-tyrosine phosphorylase [unclassified Agromyces]MDR5700156.1 bifunctional [glutamine synthetase] adenylyltransferase/[glutamine synthetase]-adenylyl-L-tyrosine phosphorylase [Agromyces sp. LY-1074]MDR5706476.1 bifunctional [glutamine synthetase] adenylyltransferase/[glutamine synthetase]-adenylyl-L-tyrosine phosphorylase [Agromyces sp. LY-1358]
MSRRTSLLGALARAGFDDLDRASATLGTLAEAGGVDPDGLIAVFAVAADPDAALATCVRLRERAPDEIDRLLPDARAAERLARVAGASRGLADFFERHPSELAVLAAEPSAPEPQADATARLTEAVAEANGDGVDLDRATRALRTRYRRLLARLAVWDLTRPSAIEAVDTVAEGLADLAGATLDAALHLARTAVSRAPGEPAAPGVFPAEEVEATRLAVIGMGKAGARELNYVSDVDVIYVGESVDEEAVPTGRAIEIATRLAMLTQRIIGEPGIEPPLWEVDPNLRPEGKDGALVRTLESHVQYYDRWAKGWEFQALLKARPLAGDRDLGDRYTAAVGPKVWASSSQDGFVESVQRMRERVTAHIPADEVDVQLKLGPGGLRDIEFTVQLLQLVHGASDDSIRQRGTLPALAALAAEGYVGREEAAEFSLDYRMLRVLEHRIQLSRLRRTHLMPGTDAERRVLARASGLGRNAAELTLAWQATRQRVRGLHERLFYRPLLSAVAALPASGLELTSAQAEARLAAIGFRDPRGALAHIGALTAGVSRRATIQRHLMPVLMSWFAEGADPDYGLLAFRRLSDALGGTHWYLGLLRDSSDAAMRLTRVLAGSRFVGELLECTPEAVAWLEDLDELRPRSLAALRDETRAVLARHTTPDAAAKVMRAMRRREVLRLALAGILDVCSIEELGHGLSDVAENHIAGVVEAIRAANPDGIEFAVIGMGRFGGRELGIGSDADIMYVYRATGDDADGAHPRAQRIVSELVRLTEDARLPFDLDAGLRPEGRNGVIVRSLDAYRAYYARWSLTWEAQALLRARGVAGDASLLEAFRELADTVRYPPSISERDVREVKRIKARVENERLPQGADPARHLKLGRGSLSDVEWYVQLVQLQHAAEVPALRTTSTLDALAHAVDAGLIEAEDAETLRAAWIIASRARSALTLWLDKTTDVLPVERAQLEGVARIMGYPPGSASALEDDYLAATRRARAVFERGFYGVESRREPTR